MGGVGKTALALVLAERLAERYPDAQFFLDLRGTSKEPLSAAQAMAHVVRAYYPTAPLPESEEELAATYRSVLHGQRALLLMDNAAGRAQVEPLHVVLRSIGAFLGVMWLARMAGSAMDALGAEASVGDDEQAGA